MNFQPQTEEEIAASLLLPDGVYPFTVASAVDKISKTSGNEMIEVTLNVFLPDSSIKQVKDYLMQAMAFKLRHFCAIANLLDQYQQGTLCARDCAGAQGFVQIKTEPARGDFGPKNAVKDYGHPKPKAGEASSTPMASPVARPNAPTERQLANLDGPNGNPLDPEDVPY